MPGAAHVTATCPLPEVPLILVGTLGGVVQFQLSLRAPLEPVPPNSTGTATSAFQTIAPDERAAFVEKKAKERSEIAEQIKELSAKRDSYIKDEVKAKGLDTNKAFDEAVRKSITEQAGKKGFEFEKKEAK